MGWNLVVDSSSDMFSTDIVSEKTDFTVVPLKIVVGEKEFVDDDSINTAALLREMKQERSGVSSACPSVGAFKEAFLKGDQTICILLTGTLSGTYNSASVARNMVLEEYPEKKIHLIDTKATAGVLELTVRKALECIEADMDFETVTKILDAYVKSVKIVFVLSNYDNLIKNGRMGFFTGAIATHLGIRAVSVNTENGEIDVKKKCRGEKKALKAMLGIMLGKKTAKESPIQISHCENEEGANSLQEMLREAGFLSEISVRLCKGLTTFYAMNGGILVAY